MGEKGESRGLARAVQSGGIGDAALSVDGGRDASPMRPRPETASSEGAFLDRMGAVLEAPVTMATRFRDVPCWSSLMGFGLLVTLENDFGRRMSVDEFLSCHTIGDLWKSVQ